MTIQILLESMRLVGAGWVELSHFDGATQSHLIISALVGSNIDFDLNLAGRAKMHVRSIDYFKEACPKIMRSIYRSRRTSTLEQ